MTHGTGADTAELDTELLWSSRVTAVEPLPLQALPHEPSSPHLASTHLFRYQNSTHPTSSSPVTPSYPLRKGERKGSGHHCPAHPPGLLLSRKYLVEILLCSLLINSAGLAKAHKDLPYLIRSIHEIPLRVTLWEISK